VIRYDVTPGVGIGPVRLNMTREESRRAMGAVPHTFKKSADDTVLTDAYHRNAFQVFFDAEDRVEYIELSFDEELQALYKGVDAHRTEAMELVACISKDAAYDPDDWELGYSYAFPALDLAVWRPVMPEGEGDEDGRCFATIGVGRRGYFSRS